MRYAFTLLLALSSACSPGYAYKSAAGHARLLWGRKPLTDGPAELQPKLKLVQDIRTFAFGELSLKPSSDYSTYAPVEGPVTWVVTGAPKLKLEPHTWWFPFIGRVPYKGYFRKEDAQREAAKLEKKGLDAYVRGVTAYNTPLWISDPLPSSALTMDTGDLASLIIHELSHGTVSFKDKMPFNESAATFIGEAGARDFLAARSKDELSAYEAALKRREARAEQLEAACKELEALYAGPLPDEKKLELREAVFKRVGEPNNAALLAQRIYRTDLGAFERLHAKLGRKWAATVAALTALDRKDPEASLLDAAK